MRALLICKEFPGFAPSGGIGTYTAVIADALAESGVECHVLCVAPGLPIASTRLGLVVVHTAPYRQLRGLGPATGLNAAAGRISHALSVWLAYRRLGLKFDVVEAPELYAEATLVGLLDRDQPLVVRLHSSYEQLAAEAQRGTRDFRATVAVENAAIRRAQIVVSTRSNLNEVAAHLNVPPEKRREIIYPIPVRPAADASSQANTVLFAGRLERRKGAELLIDAAAAVRAVIPDVKFKFAGSDTHDAEVGSYQRFLEQRARDGSLDGCIEFLGALDRDRLAAEMSAATVCAFPSTWESFGLVVAEAASIQKPVVVSDIAAFRDFVTDGVTGRIVPRPEPGLWADALIGALQARDDHMAAKLRQELQARAAPDIVAELVLDSYRSAIEAALRR